MNKLKIVKMCCDSCANRPDTKWIKIFFAFLTFSNLVKSKSKYKYSFLFKKKTPNTHS